VIVLQHNFDVCLVRQRAEFIRVVAHLTEMMPAEISIMFGNLWWRTASHIDSGEEWHAPGIEICRAI
jgi:hypothetical protein